MKNAAVTPIRGAERASEFVVDMVSMDAVPEPPISHRSGKYADIFKKIQALGPNRALRVKVPNEKVGYFARIELRKKATKAKRLLSSSREAGNLTWYFWLEPEGTAVPGAPGGKR